MSPVNVRRLAPVLLIGAPLLTVGVVMAGITPVGMAGTEAGRPGAAAVAAAYVAPSSAHPYSDPVWWPLRSPALASCVKTNCRNPYFHNYWALDLVADPPWQSGDPIYAAGAGVFHIGAVDWGCKATTKDEGGTWVWVDHGGGKVSRYHHLSSVTAQEGQRVTPTTLIGRMGHSGDVAPCRTNYLHFEVRVGGVKGTRVDPGSLLACRGTRERWPNAWGKTSWDALTARSVTTPTTTSGCVTTPWAGTPVAPAPVRGTRGSGRATVTWPSQSAVANRVVVAMETYHPSVPEWGAPTYRTLAATARSSTYTSLQNGRKYRWKVTSHNAGGNSAWSSYVNLTPAAVPTTPRVPRWLAATTSKIRYAWWSSTARGTPVTSYTVAIRTRTSTGYTTWRRSPISAGVLNRNWTPVTGGRTYQVTVRANSAVGSSPWASYRSITVPR